MQKALPDGLILRTLSEGHAQDRERLLPFYQQVYAGDWNTNDDEWAAVLLSGQHPTVTDDDVWVVVDPAKDDKIVSTTLLIPQVWRYETVELPVGRPELVATDPDYRQRGLVRTVMDAVHERSAALGQNVQAITGIPHFYRRFGYTMAVELGFHAMVPLASVPKLKEDQQPAYTLRPATEADFAMMEACDTYLAPQFALSVVRSAPMWQQIISRTSMSLQVVVDKAGAGVGYVALHRYGDDETLTALTYVIGDRASYLATYDDVLRGVKAYAEATYPDNVPLYIGFDSGQPEALNILLARTAAAHIRKRYYAWYMRAASPARLIMDIKPVLEQRLKDSGAHRYSGEVRINFFTRKGLRIVFDQGCITAAEDIELPGVAEQEACDAAFPWDYFLNIVFGHRTYHELQHVLTECFANSKTEVLFDILFPKKPARLFAIF